MMGIRKIQPSEDQIGKRADQFFSEALGLSRNCVAMLLEEGHITLHGNSIKKNEKIRAEIYQVTEPEPKFPNAQPENIPIDIIYEDRDLLVVNKARGMVVHPAAGNETGTLVNALLYHCRDGLSGINGVLRPGIVHRIDKDTSGLLIVAKNDEAHKGLAHQIESHSFEREYECLAYGNFKEESGTLSFPIARHPVERKKMAVVDGGRNAVTHYKVLEGYPRLPLSYLRLKLETGRTHQIRVHLSHIGHPIIGDPVYGNKASGKVFPQLDGQCLHARYIGFMHPITGEFLSFESELPVYFQELLQKARKLK